MGTISVNQSETYGNATAEMTYTVGYTTTERSIDVAVTASSVTVSEITTWGGTSYEQLQAKTALQNKRPNRLNFNADGNEVLALSNTIEPGSSYSVEGTGYIEKLATIRKAAITLSVHDESYDVDSWNFMSIQIPATELSAVNIYDENGSLAFGHLYGYDENGNLTNLKLSAYDLQGNKCNTMFKVYIPERSAETSSGYGFGFNLKSAEEFLYLLPIKAKIEGTITGRVSSTSPEVSENIDLDLTLGQSITVELKSESTTIATAKFNWSRSNSSAQHLLMSDGLTVDFSAKTGISGLQIYNSSYALIDGTRPWVDE